MAYLDERTGVHGTRFMACTSTPTLAIRQPLTTRFLPSRSAANDAVPGTAHPASTATPRRRQREHEALLVSGGQSGPEQVGTD